MCSAFANTADDGSTGDKQTSKGLFIIPPTPKGGLRDLLIRALFFFSELRDECFFYKNYLPYSPLGDGGLPYSPLGDGDDLCFNFYLYTTWQIKL